VRESTPRKPTTRGELSAKMGTSSSDAIFSLSNSDFSRAASGGRSERDLTTICLPAWREHMRDRHELKNRRANQDFANHIRRPLHGDILEGRKKSLRSFGGQQIRNKFALSTQHQNHKRLSREKETIILCWKKAILLTFRAPLLDIAESFRGEGEAEDIHPMNLVLRPEGSKKSLKDIGMVMNSRFLHLEEVERD
jgi:hypothetical protein